MIWRTVLFISGPGKVDFWGAQAHVSRSAWVELAASLHVRVMRSVHTHAFNGVPKTTTTTGLSLLNNLAGPVQHFKDAILDACRNKVSVDLRGQKGFRGGLCWIYTALCSSLTLLMLGKEMRLCFGVLWLECLEWFSAGPGWGVSLSRAGSVEHLMVMVTFLLGVYFSSSC